MSRLALGLTQPPVQWVLGAISSLGKEAGVLQLTAIYCRGEKWWSYTFTPPYVFMV
jgi:hypothetical protein